MNKDFDVAVIGAGPAGSTAAYLLNKSGFNVVIIDRSYFPRNKLCGGLITAKTLKFLERIYHDNEETLIKNNVINYSTNKFYFLNKKKELENGFTKIPTHFVERIIYDKYLLDKAVDSGVKIIYGDEVKKIEFESTKIVTSNGNTIHSKYIIGADGANSVVRKEFEKKGLIENNYWSSNLGFALETIVDKDKLLTDKDSMYLFFGYIKIGYLWVFPNKEKAVIGAGGLLKNLDINDLKNLVSDFLLSYGVDKNTVEKCIKSIKGHPIPFGNFIHNPVHKNIVLIGDAAGFVNPITGEGIYYAQKSAELAAEAIIKDNKKQGILEEEYYESLNRFILPELSKILKSRGLYFKFFNNYYLAKTLMYLKYRKIKYI